jgi:diguanylate cyclase (GGDEF)-like protein/PAS domain S-box-containing protein
MPGRPVASPSMLSRLAPRVLVILFALAMSGCVLGLVVWKSVAARDAALAQSEVEVKNLTHSLAEHATHIFQSADVAMSGMVDLLKYQNPLAVRFNKYLADTTASLPQIREIGVLDSAGNWRYSSLPDTPAHNNADRDYFIYHRDNADPALRINAPLLSRLTGRWSMLLTRRISAQDGSFVGVLIAAIDENYWSDVYQAYKLGGSGGVTLMRADGVVLARWPSMDATRDVSKSNMFQIRLKQSPVGFYQIVSPFDGITKYIGYERSPIYPIVVSVAQAEDELLAGWRDALKSDLLVALGLLCAVIAMAMLLSVQFESRLKAERALREHEQRYRLLADNIADIVVLLDRNGILRYVSHSIAAVLGRAPQDLIGQSCFDLVHPDDVELLRRTSADIAGTAISRTVLFRSYRADGSEVWMESNFKAAARAGDEPFEVVGVLRDVSERKKMEDELTSLNARLGELATTDGLTGLANRRTFDGFLRREFESCDQLAVVLFDIDHFKGFNDAFGHQAGDECLARVAQVIAEATEGTRGMSARYGGEEFVIVLPGLSEAMAFIVAEAVRLKIRALEIAHPSSGRAFLSVSAGIACKSATTADEAALLGEADRALYEAKRLGRNCTVRSVAHLQTPAELQG